MPNPDVKPEHETCKENIDNTKLIDDVRSLFEEYMREYRREEGIVPPFKVTILFLEKQNIIDTKASKASKRIKAIDKIGGRKAIDEIEIPKAFIDTTSLPSPILEMIHLSLTEIMEIEEQVRRNIFKERPLRDLTEDSELYEIFSKTINETLLGGEFLSQRLGEDQHKIIAKGITKEILSHIKKAEVVKAEASAKAEAEAKVAEDNNVIIFEDHK